MGIYYLSPPRPHRLRGALAISFMKQCSKCKKLLPESSFYKDKKRKNGLFSSCKECSPRKESRRKYMRKYWKNNPTYRQKRRKYILEYDKKRKKVDIRYHLDTIMKSALSNTLKGKKDRQRWGKLSGYTLDDLITHLEKQFTSEMSWNNYGLYWEIDHRIPKSWFDYKTAEDEEFKKCWALENLQPLEKLLNRKKHNCYAN